MTPFGHFEWIVQHSNFDQSDIEEGRGLHLLRTHAQHLSDMPEGD
jgi:hypothetical protein